MRISGATLSAASARLSRRAEWRDVCRVDKAERAERGAHRVGDVGRRQMTIVPLDHRVSLWPSCAAITASGTLRIASRLA